MKISALEEHYVLPSVASAWERLPHQGRDPMASLDAASDLARNLASLGERRLALMDDAGIDVQVLSLTTPGLFDLPAVDAVALQTAINNEIAEAVSRHPQRFHAFATLAPQNPEQAAAELDRAVRELGFDGALIFGRVQGESIDHKQFWPLFEAAEALRAPLYLHPQTPPLPVRQAYYGGLGDQVGTALATYGVGWHYDAGLQFLRLVLAGVFDRFPNLQIILGHWGEMLPFYLDRVDGLAGVAHLERTITDYVCHNAFLTPGGVFSHRYLKWALEVVGSDRVMFAADFPYVPTRGGGARAFLAEAELTDNVRDKIASGTWDQIRAEIRR
ncbi:amidohydrolase family protein [Mycobacteroides chelonae]|uniref:amidohydrolase family protein n=1 Tax=Mycobacteroides chelonae TaxID=1774 RepID=UPI000D6A6221|nr:amidohydrolase family protein [Mycobacteroides chelonae]